MFVDLHHSMLNGAKCGAQSNHSGVATRESDARYQAKVLGFWSQGGAMDSMHGDIADYI